jgi:hypothetical protein
MADANKKPKPEKQFWTVPRSKNNATPNKKPQPEKQFWTVPRSKNNDTAKEKPKSEKKHQPAKAPLCHHHYGDCEADIPVEVLQNASVPLGQYCETLKEQRAREEEEVCWYDECYHPE